MRCPSSRRDCVRGCADKLDDNAQLTREARGPPGDKAGKSGIKCVRSVNCLLALDVSLGGFPSRRAAWRQGRKIRHWNGSGESGGNLAGERLKRPRVFCQAGIDGAGVSFLETGTAGAGCNRARKIVLWENVVTDVRAGDSAAQRDAGGPPPSTTPTG